MSHVSHRQNVVGGGHHGRGLQFLNFKNPGLGVRALHARGVTGEGAEAAVAGAGPGQATLISADFHDMDAVDRFWREAQEAAQGPIDVLINRAPRDQFRRGELVEEITRTYQPASFGFVPSDDGVERAAAAIDSGAAAETLDRFVVASREAAG